LLKEFSPFFFFFKKGLNQCVCVSDVDDRLMLVGRKVWRKCGFIRTCCCSKFLGSYYVYLWPVRLPVGDSVLSSKHYVAYASVYFVV